MSFDVIAACCLAWLAPTHSLPENHLERAVQVYVYPERVEIHYHLGLTDRQVGLELAALAPGEPLPGDPAEALRRYEQLVAPLLAGEIRLLVDGESRPLSICGIDRRERHHERFVVECEAQVRFGPEPRRVEVRDLTRPGVAAIECRRLALRGRGDVEVTECSGQPTLIRAPRQPVPARAYRPHEPSRTIVAVCRIPGTASGADAVADDTPQPEPVGEATAPAPQVVEESTGGTAAVAANAAGEARSGESNGTVAASADDRPTGVSRSAWLVAAGIALILLGCLFAAAAVKRAGQRRCASDSSGRGL